MCKAYQKRESASKKSAPQAQKRAVGPGLVYSETKGTPQDQYHLDPREIRLRRLRRAVVTSARLHTQTLTNSKFRHKTAMITLTYADIAGWRPSHIKEFLRHVRQYLSRRSIPCRYVWVAELQQRGAMHYHVILWLPKGITLPKPDKRGWWVHGSTRVEWAKKAVAYVAKYASKVESKGGDMPRGARLYGIGGLELADRRERSWWMLPQYIRETSPDPRETGITKRARGGGWVTPFGEWIPSLYKIVSFNPLTIRKVKPCTQ